MKTLLTTQQQIREAFWVAHPELELEARKRRTRSQGQNQQTTDCRCAFVEFVDRLARDGDISNALAERVTL